MKHTKGTSVMISLAGSMLLMMMSVCLIWMPDMRGGSIAHTDEMRSPEILSLASAPTIEELRGEIRLAVTNNESDRAKKLYDQMHMQAKSVHQRQ